MCADRGDVGRDDVAACTVVTPSYAASGPLLFIYVQGAPGLLMLAPDAAPRTWRARYDAKQE